MKLYTIKYQSHPWEKKKLIAITSAAAFNRQEVNDEICGITVGLREIITLTNLAVRSSKWLFAVQFAVHCRFLSAFVKERTEQKKKKEKRLFDASILKDIDTAPCKI